MHTRKSKPARKQTRKPRAARYNGRRTLKGGYVPDVLPATFAEFENDYLGKKNRTTTQKIFRKYKTKKERENEHNKRSEEDLKSLELKLIDMYGEKLTTFCNSIPDDKYESLKKSCNTKNSLYMNKYFQLQVNMSKLQKSNALPDDFKKYYNNQFSNNNPTNIKVTFIPNIDDILIYANNLLTKLEKSNEDNTNKKLDEMMTELKQTDKTDKDKLRFCKAIYQNISTFDKSKHPKVNEINDICESIKQKTPMSRQSSKNTQNTSGLPKLPSRDNYLKQQLKLKLTLVTQIIQNNPNVAESVLGEQLLAHGILRASKNLVNNHVKPINQSKFNQDTNKLFSDIIMTDILDKIEFIKLYKKNNNNTNIYNDNLRAVLNIESKLHEGEILTSNDLAVITKFNEMYKDLLTNLIKFLESWLREYAKSLSANNNNFSNQALNVQDMIDKINQNNNIVLSKNDKLTINDILNNKKVLTFSSGNDNNSETEA